MEKFISLVFVLCFTLNVNAQKSMTSRDSINVFYDSLFTTMKAEYLYKNKVNWAELESKLKQNLLQYTSFQTSLDELKTIFDDTKATHCSVFFNDKQFISTSEGFSVNDFSEQWMKKYATNPAFEVKVLDNKYGYILMPGMMFDDVSAENIHNLAQPMYDQIVAIKASCKLNGWIIDLRFNNGGNIYPMLLALYDFLGDNTVYGTLDINRKLILTAKIKNGKYFDNNEFVSHVIPKGKKLTKTKVAIITGIVTGSSGEITAMAFKGRKNTIFIGEPTVGKTTTNDRRELPFGAVMSLTIGYDCDRNKVFYEKILPKVLVSKKDNFDNLLLDQNIQKAINWISNPK